MAATATASTAALTVTPSGANTESNGSNSSKRANNKDEVQDGSNLMDNEEKSSGRNGSSKKINDRDKANDSLTNFKPSPRFWAILITCAVIGLLSALENTVITTALPHIVAELEMGENYVWITNAFFLTGYVSRKLVQSRVV